MDNQAVSYQTTYSLRGNFIFDYLGQSQTNFTEISSEPPPAVLKLQTPVERKEQQRHLLFERILQGFTDLKLPGEEQAINYLTHKFRRNCKGATLASSDTAIRFFLTFLRRSGKEELKDITRKDIEVFVEQLQDRGLTINSVRNRLVAVYSFIQFLVDSNFLAADILLKKIRLKLPDALPRAIDSDDIKRLFAVMNHPRNRAMFLLLLRTGMRIGELLDLRPDDVNLQERKVLIYIGEKNHQGRVVYFSDDAHEALEEWMKLRNPSRQCLFHSSTRHSLTYPAVRTCFVKCLEKADLEHKGYTIHQLRHTFATDLLNAGMRIECLQPLLGHSTLEMTRRYAKLSDKSRENEYFKAMSIIERGMTDEDSRLDHQLQTVLEEKELFSSHC